MFAGHAESIYYLRHALFSFLSATVHLMDTVCVDYILC